MTDSATPGKVFFVGAGPGDPELLTLKGMRILQQANSVIYAGSLVNDKLLELCPNADAIDSAPLCLDDIIAIMARRVHAGETVVRLHSGDPSLYGAISEQIRRLRRIGIEAEVVPGVTSLSAAAAALASELTVPGISQSVIITRAGGRTPVPEREGLASLAAHQATMAVFLSAALAARVEAELLEHYPPETPVAVVQRASWPQQRILRGTLAGLAAMIEQEGIRRTAIILVGASLGQDGEESKLYDAAFSHGYRESQDRQSGQPASRDRHESEAPEETPETPQSDHSHKPERKETD